jgi:hypothetical protein
MAEFELGAFKPGVQLSSGDSAKGAEKSEKGNSEREGLTPWSSQNGVKCSRSTTHVLMGRICHHKNKGYVKVKPSNVHASWRECCRFPSACRTVGLGEGFKNSCIVVFQLRTISHTNTQAQRRHHEPPLSARILLIFE